MIKWKTKHNCLPLFLLWKSPKSDFVSRQISKGKTLILCSFLLFNRVIIGQRILFLASFVVKFCFLFSLDSWNFLLIKMLLINQVLAYNCIIISIYLLFIIHYTLCFWLKCCFIISFEIFKTNLCFESTFISNLIIFLN